MSGWVVLAGFAVLVAVAVIAVAIGRARGRRRPASDRSSTARDVRAVAVLEASPDGTALLAATRITYVNRAFRQLFAMSPDEPGTGGDLLDLVVPADRERVDAWLQRRQLGSPEPERLEFGARRRSGAELPLEATASLVPTEDGRQLALFVRDLSGRRALELRLDQLVRLEALAELGERVAGEFEGIFRRVRALARATDTRGLTEPNGPLESIESIERLAARGVALARRVRAVAPHPAPRREPIDLVRLLLETAADFQRTLPDALSLKVVTGPEDRPDQRLVAVGDAGQLRQALFQLLANARDAQPTGEIQLRARALDLDLATASLRPGSRPGPYAVLEVRDEGPGMDEETRARATQPFFTTKGRRATGLGLTIVFGTVRAHEGFMELESVPGRGTLARIALPRADETAVVPRRIEAAADPRARWGGPETVLLVDAVAGRRDARRHGLEAFGYHVEVAANPREALVRLRHRPAVDLVIAQLEDPAAESDLVDRIVRRWPDQRVVARLDRVGRGEAGAGAPDAGSPDALAKAVRDALDAPPQRVA